MIIPVILSGGTGSRLWPLSRELYPKQFLPLLNDQTLFQNTVGRVQTMADAVAPMVICNEEHRFMVAEQLHMLSVMPKAVILEPIGRNTAPAVTVAALHAKAMLEDEDPILLVLPADHVIKDVAGFQKTIVKAIASAEAGKLITFGIVPDNPETGYGYIQAGQPLANDMGYIVECFEEKPDAVTAQRYVESGNYYWNSGMFMFRASCFLEEMQHFAPAIVDSCQQAQSAAKTDLDFLRLDKLTFANCPSDSIDYAVMEKTSNAVVVPLDVGWNDVGAWSALWKVGNRDEQGNIAEGDTLALDTQNSYIRSENRLVVTLGVNDTVVIETADAVLVAARDRVQDVKSVVNQLKATHREEAHHHRKVYRPWGNYDSTDNANRFQVKRITVNPGGRLSSQMHHHRAEHWIVVSGTARVTRGDEVFLLTENQSTYIPLGIKHRLENPGIIPLELIEVQSGSYLGEDDIVRFDDVYGRHDESC
jgi:mannose-1-phosphate guanylyltransferase/mannose-6-phosphate isomerase